MIAKSTFTPPMAELCAGVPGINVIGVESAANPDYLRLVVRKVLEENGPSPPGRDHEKGPTSTEWWRG